MHITQELKTSLSISNNANVITDQIYRNLLELCFSILTREPDTPTVSNLYNFKPDVVKELQAAWMTIIAEFARNDLNREAVMQFLTQEINLNPARASLFGDLYDRNKLRLQIILGNVGTHLPHVVDAKWKIDYVIKTSALDEADGPMFRICLSTQTYDDVECRNKIEKINFSCNGQELQDLVYKLKEAVRFCQKVATEH